MTRPALAALAVALACVAAHAASRARYGGALKVAIAGKMTETDPLHADLPLEAALISLVAQPLCRLDSLQRLEPTLAAEFASPTGSSLEVKLSPALRGDGKPLTATDAALALRRALAEPTPYRGLLLPLAEPASISATGADRLTFKLAFPWPDLDRSLCHPAMALARAPRSDGAGPFAALVTQGTYGPQRGYPRGRPYVDAVSMAAFDARGAARQLAQRKVHLALGIAAPDAPVPLMVSATYLLWSPQRAGPDVRAALEKAVNREDLTRFFARSAPAAPMTALLPPLLMPERPALTALPAPAPGGQRSLALTFDAASEDHRAVAERLQFRLQSLGYRVALEPLARHLLREAWKKGDYTLMLQQVLLPPVAAPALAVVLTLARKSDAAARLKPLGALADAKERAERARALSTELAPQLDLLPLYVQGLSLQAAPGLSPLQVDGFGLPRLDDVFLSGDVP